MIQSEIRKNGDYRLVVFYQTFSYNMTAKKTYHKEP